MLFKGNSSRLELLIGKIHAHKEPSQDEQHKSKVSNEVSGNPELTKKATIVRDVLPVECTLAQSGVVQDRNLFRASQGSGVNEALGTGSSSWHSEDGGPNSRRGGETPSSCATPTSASFPSEPEVDVDVSVNPDGNNPAAPYPCQFCDKTFPRLSYLKKHEQSHGDQMPYRCSWCNRLFKHKRSRDRHVKLHTGDRRYRCSKCEAAFSRSDHLKIHLKTHDTQRPYQCTACTRGYSSAAALTSHMQSHKKHHQSSSSQSTGKDVDYGRRSVSSHSTSSPPVPSSPSPSLNLSLNSRNVLKTSQGTGSTSTTPILNSPLKLACMYCTRDSFSCMQQLQIHVRTMHQAILSGAESLARPSSPSRTSSEQQAVFCSRDKPDRKDSSKDPRSDRKYPSEERVDRPAGERDHYENAFTCDQCTMKFSTLACLRDHSLSIHRVDSGFSATMVICPLCGIPCTSTAAYAEHYVLQHCENRRPQTTSIDYNETKLNGVYNSTPARDSRMPRSRDAPEAADLTNKRPTRPSTDAAGSYTADTLLCGQCDAALKDFESFREHVARHLQADHRNQEMSNRQHLCPKCETVFPSREDMLAHLTKHYVGQISKEFVCGACKKFYPHPDQLQRHLLDAHAHHLYRCALCRDTFDSKVAIQVHFAVKHSQECRIYRCSVCTLSNNENSPPGTNAAPGDSRSFFRSEAEMAAHVRNVHAPPPVVPSLSNSSPVRATTRSPASTPGIITTRCVFCGTCCSSELELQLHLASHSGSLYRCPICREGFAVEFLLDRHVAQVHHQTAQDHHVPSVRNRENGRVHRPTRNQEETKSLKRGRSPALSNNNSLNQRDNNKRSNYGTSGQQCELCERGEFANEAELQAHKKLAHTPSKLSNKALSTLSMTCGYCGEVCRSRNELESHTRIQHASNESSGRHKCNICDEVCPSGANLAEHKLQKHCKIQLSDTCVVCRGCLTSESQFLDHVQRHNLDNVDPQQRLDSTLPHLPAPCIVCRQTLISDLECRLHARHHLRTSSSLRSTGSSPTSPGGDKGQNQGCCLCLRDFAAEDFVNLPPNPANTSGQLLRVCKPCYMRHSQGLPILNSTTYEHRAKYETTWLASKDVQWDETKDKWEHERGLKIEDRSRNEGNVNKKRCEDCGVKFEDFEEAEKHRIAEHEKAVGSGSNTSTCIQCQVSFSTEANIQQHVRKKHLETSRKASLEALRCHLCLFEAASPMQLQIHLIEHTFAGCAALSCYICQSLFTTPIGLQNHMLQEHGLDARPYDCSKCTLKFFFSAELDHHVLTFHHPGEEIHSSSVESAHETKIRESKKRDDDVIVKEEVVQSGKEKDEEEEEVNVDDQVGHHEEAERNEQKLKTEVNNEATSGKMES
ncbi:ZN423 protein, partial [Pseudoatta argentina]